ncbi:MAG: hypothetical protein KAJ16_12325 [Calditrichia bacterium]|nr:hypothetical protein [Calditrichia bacterium]
MVLKTYLNFFFKSYIRSHRYLREIILILIFHIFFWGFLNTETPDDMVWTVFGVLALLLNMVTVPSLFYLEKGNSLYFTLVHQSGRAWYYISKLVLILCIDFFWIFLFALIYGLRFLELQYFVLLPFRLLLLILLMSLSVLILSLSFSYRPWIAWVLLILIVFGGILNKIALFPIKSFSELYVILSFLLPPLLEIIYGTATLQFDVWRGIFIFIALTQIVIYFYINFRLIMKKDFL